MLRPLPSTPPPFLRLLLALVLGAVALFAQDPPPGQAPQAQDPEGSPAAIQARIDAVKADSTLPEDLATQLVEALTRALEQAKGAATRRDATRQFAAQRDSAPDLLAQRRAELDAIEGRKPGPQRQGLSLDELEQGLTAAEQAHRDALQRVAAADAERARRAQRRTEIPARMTALQTELQQLPENLPDQGGADVRLVAARRLALTTERRRVQAEIDQLQAEVQAYDAEVELLRAEGDVAARLVTSTQADAEAWRAAVQPMRERVAAAAAAQAKDQAARASPQVEPIATENAALAQELSNLATERAIAEQDKTRRQQEKLQLGQQFEAIKKRVEVGGSDERIGRLLRRRRSELTERWRLHLQSARTRQDNIIEAQLAQIEYEERRQRIVQDPESWLVDNVGGPDVAAQLTEAQRRVAEELRTGRRDLLVRLADGYKSLYETEAAVESIELELTELFTTYREFVTERVFGIRSSDPLWSQPWSELDRSIASLLAPEGWSNVLSSLWTTLVRDAWVWLATLVALGLLGYRRRFAAAVRRQGEQAEKGTNVAYKPTLLAALFTLLIAIPVPLLLLVWGYRLARHADGAPMTLAVSQGLIAAGFGLSATSLLAAVVRPKGLAESHWRWQATSLALIRPTMLPLLIAAGPLAVLLRLFRADAGDDSHAPLAAVTLLAQLALFAWIARRMLHPKTGIAGGSLRPQPGVAYRFRRAWYALGVGMLAALIVMTVLGYQYTVHLLKMRAFYSASGLIMISFVHAMILRKLLLERRRLQIQQAKARLQAARSGEAPEEETAHEVDPRELAEQTQALLRGATVIAAAVLLYQVWAEVLPALGALRQFELWNIGSETAEQWITMADVVLGLFLIGASVAAARNLPGLLELFVLQRFSMKAGERNAIATLARYAILVFGVLWAFSSIGVGWSKVQWLVAAVSVGLGFGLQEIFANFVSGLILLIERPMRPGDVVTVGENSGRVTKIQIRATTIRDWNLKELVVPNREFVTGRFVNWTLGDPKVRYIVPVGVAYGTDTSRALPLLLEAARTCKLVLSDPPPEALFVGFGDSTLNLELRVFVDIDEVGLAWMTEVHQSIQRTFAENDIEIAFPQRDVHLKLPDSLDRHLRGQTAAAPAPERPAAK